MSARSEEILDIVYSTEGALSDLANSVVALMRSIGIFAEIPDSQGQPGDLDYYVADALAGKLEHDHHSLKKLWDRLFELTRRARGHEPSVPTD